MTVSVEQMNRPNLSTVDTPNCRNARTSAGASNVFYAPLIVRRANQHKTFMFLVNVPIWFTTEAEISPRSELLQSR